VRSERWAAWKWLLIGSAVLAIPTAAIPGSVIAGPAYLLGSLSMTSALYYASSKMPRRQRLPWLLLAGVATLWFTGDALQRFTAAVGWTSPTVGFPDVFWLASYLLEITAVNALIKAKGLPAAVARDIRLDVIIIVTAAALGAWHVLIEPGLGTDPSLLNTVVSVLYPLGDVVIFSLALTVLLVPGSRGPATLMLVACLGITLPLDFLFQTVQTRVPSFNASRLDAVFLMVNSMLGAAALHPSRTRLTERAREGVGRHLQVWRIGVLGLSLVAVSVTNVFVKTSGLRTIPDVVATLIISMTIILRFYRTARSQERTAAALRKLADHDQLTGVANRALLRRRLPDFITASQGLLIYIDLDGFKAVNDSYGHHMGDAVLRAVTARLANIVRETDTIARMGGDEFVVLLHGSGYAEAPEVAQRILDDLRQPVVVDSCVMQVGASVGVVAFDPTTSGQAVGDGAGDHVPDRHGEEREQHFEALADDILHWADTAMYEVKRQGGGIRIVRYEEDLLPTF
jgi:diguanylate cyclase (GGDEF)-like protein